MTFQRAAPSSSLSFTCITRSPFVLVAVIASLVDAAYLDRRQASSSSVTQYPHGSNNAQFFRPNAHGRSALSGEDRPHALWRGDGFVFLANPLQTAIPIAGNTNGSSFFQLHDRLRFGCYLQL